MNIYNPYDVAASMLQTIERLKGNTLTAEQAKTQIASNVKTGNAKVKPTSAGLKELNAYIAKHYPDGKTPKNLAEAQRLATEGGINDMGIAMRVQADIGDRTQGKAPLGTGGATDPLGAAAKLVNSPNPRLAQYYGYDMPALLGDTLSAPVDLAKAQDAERLGPTGPGLFGDVLNIAALLTGGPASPLAIPAGLFSMGTGAREGNPIKAFGSLAGVAASDGAFNNILTDLGGGGFKNPDALGLGDKAGGLYSPEALSAPAGTTVRGFEGLSSSSLYRPEALTGTWGAFDFAPRPGLEGLKPEQLYQPEALGGPGKKPSWKDALDALDFPSGRPQQQQGGQGMPPVTNIYQPDAVPYTYGTPQMPQTLKPGFFGGAPDAQDLFGGNKPGTKHGTRAGAVDSVLRNAQPWNIYA